jgi:hypothetical protein
VVVGATVVVGARVVGAAVVVGGAAVVVAAAALVGAAVLDSVPSVVPSLLLHAAATKVSDAATNVRVRDVRSGVRRTVRRVVMAADTRADDPLTRDRHRFF